MNGRGWSEVLRRWGLPVVFLVAAYGALYQRSWSVDGCLHTLGSHRFIDPSDTGHLLLRPVIYLWVSFGKQAGLLVTRAQQYDALHFLFAGLGIAALTMLFGTARRRGGDGAAWACLVIIALASNCVEQIVTLDEKPLGMVLFAVAVLATERLFQRAEVPPAYPLSLRAVLPAATAWTIAGFGHEQNVPYAAAFLVALLFLPPTRGMPFVRRFGGMVAVGACMALGTAALFTALTWESGGLSNVRSFVHRLLVPAYLPPPPASALRLGLDTLEGWTKAFLVVDRLSPKSVLALAAAAFVVLAAGVGWGFARRRDGLSGMLLGASLFLMLFAPLVNYWPGLGDSYTSVTMGAFALLATAPRRLLVPLMVLVAAINVPAAAIRSHPGITVQRHLEAAIRIERSQHAPWIILESLSHEGGEQRMLPVYYPMVEGLRYGRATLDSLPPGRFLVDLPLNLRRDGSARPGRVDDVQRDLERRGRRVSRGLIWSPPRILRSDWCEYGNYLLVGPRPSRP